MTDVRNSNAQAAAEAAARQAAAMRAAAEAQRLAAVQAEQARAAATAPAAAEPAPNAPIARDLFVTDGQVPGGGDAEAREALYQRYNTDGQDGLTESELNDLFTAEDDGPVAAATTEGVQSDLDQALKDDTDTGEDLIDAAGNSHTPEDVDAIMAVAEARGEDQEAVLRAVLEERDEGAEAPNTEVYEAVAAHYDRLGKPDLAAAARVAGDPAVSPDVRKKLTHALQDGDDTEDDLLEAAKSARTPEDLAAVMTVNVATGAADPHEILQETLKGLDETADVPNTALLEAIADQFEALDKPELAEAARRAGNPALSSDVRKELIHAIQDDTDTAEDIKDAMEKSDTELEQLAAETTGDATIGTEHTDHLKAVAEVKDAQEAYDKAVEDVASHNQTLQQAMGQMQGMNPEQQQAFITEFKGRHPEYAAVDAAQAELARVVTDNQAAIGDALQSGDALAEVDTEALEKALTVAASDPAGLEAATAIATQVLQHADSVSEDRLKLIAEKVLPEVFKAQLEAGLERHNGDAVAAMEEFEASPLGEALAQVEETTGVTSDVKTFYEGVQELSVALKTGNVDAAADVINESAAKADVDRLGGALASMGIVFGAMAFANASGFVAKTQAALEVSSSGADVIAAVGGSFGRLSAGGRLGLEALEKAGPVIGSVASAISGFRNLADGNYLDAAVDGASVALGILAMTTAIPGLGIASGILAGGLFVYQAWKANNEAERRTDEIRDVMDTIGIEKGMADFLTNSEGGAYENTLNHLGLTPGQLEILVADGSPWTRQLDDFATAGFAENVAPLLGGDVPAALDRLGEGLGDQGVEFVADVLQLMSGPGVDPVTGEPQSTQESFNTALSTLNATYFNDPAERGVAIANLQAALGL